MESIAPRYCPRCGTAMPDPPKSGHLTCSIDGYIWYGDPKIATGVLVSRSPNLFDATKHPAKKRQDDSNSAESSTTAAIPDELLLVRRNHDPAMGHWAFPSGFVDAGEIVEHAAIREVFEETSVEIVLDHLIGVYSETGNAVVFIAYAGTLVSGEATAGDEAFEVGWFRLDKLPDLAFPHDNKIVSDWKRLQTLDTNST